MRDRTPLLLMEQLVMILVFALTAAVCLRAFALSHEISRENEARDRAVTVAQNAAERIKYCGGSGSSAPEFAAEQLGGTLSDGVCRVDYGADWRKTDTQAVYRLEIRAADAAAGLAGAELQVVDLREAGTEPLVSLAVFWQEAKDER